VSWWGGRKITSSKKVYSSGSSGTSSIRSFTFKESAVGKYYAIMITGATSDNQKRQYSVSGAKIIWDEITTMSPSSTVHIYAAFVQATDSSISVKLSAGVLYGSMEMSEII
jgi:hypothetical protein